MRVNTRWVSGQHIKRLAYSANAPDFGTIARLLFYIARADGDITEPEWAYIAEVVTYLDMMTLNLQDYQKSITDDALPHQILGVAKTASYRGAHGLDAPAKDHPDQLIAKGMPLNLSMRLQIN